MNLFDMFKNYDIYKVTNVIVKNDIHIRMYIKKNIIHNNTFYINDKTFNLNICQFNEQCRNIVLCAITYIDINNNINIIDMKRLTCYNISTFELDFNKYTNVNSITLNFYIHNNLDNNTNYIKTFGKDNLNYDLYFIKNKYIRYYSDDICYYNGNSYKYKLDECIKDVMCNLLLTDVKHNLIKYHPDILNYDKYKYKIIKIDYNLKYLKYNYVNNINQNILTMYNKVLYLDCNHIITYSDDKNINICDLCSNKSTKYLIF